MVGEIENASAMDVVRCKECKYNYGLTHGEYNAQDIVCEYWATDGVHENDFCSRGERIDAKKEGA